ncbi:hypothetical protein WR25_24539 [Diploscapter pachys]|uniref:VLRF1 domain-containing protein n=1 Tax=Diploscapter pachys TaxID=2018661 RepID=A0A2A2KK79_9BILA|nr:hypothetical protein WR25_24539 [Diploscapter pachys]
MLGSYTGLKTRDQRWLSGVEPLNDVLRRRAGPENEEDEEFYDAMEKFGRGGCGLKFIPKFENHNAKLLNRGKAPLQEEEFDDLSDGEATSSDESSNEESENEIRFPLQNSRLFFAQNDRVFSLYRCILRDLEYEASSKLFTQPLDCVILLLNGGHFAGGVFENDRLMERKTFHRYVARAKQGTVQSQHDKAAGKAHSAGANLRRYNEQQLSFDIRRLLTEWNSALISTPLIFIRCASYQMKLFQGEDSPIEKRDKRIRNIPFESRRPTVDEVKRIWERLGRVFEHGSREEFFKKLQETKESLKKSKILQKKAKERQRLRTLTDSEEERDVTGEKEIKQKRKDHLKSREIHHENDEPDQWPLLEADWRKKLYAAARVNNVEEVRKLVAEKQNENSDENQAILYLRNRRYPPDNSTLLHIVTHKCLDSMVEYLLEIGCDPSLKNAGDKPPYAITTDKQIRAIFVAYREKNPDEWNWAKCHIPAPIVKTEEQLLKEAEKKKEKNVKKKEKQREKKEADRKEEEEKKAREAYLGLTDREKRALVSLKGK